MDAPAPDADAAPESRTGDANAATPPQAPWWRRGVVYQVYPRSFQDSNGDGVGDLRGIIRRLDHVEGLGADAIWISPIYPSPMADFGYDVADYCGVAPIFGTLEDFDALVAAAHARSIRVILDFVPNHSSDQHPWFLESRASCHSPKRDWYIWRNPAPGGGPPNNWRSQFGGSAWEWDAATGQYYLHSFLTQQPDLNWRNPDLRRAMLDVLRFWLDRGVDGFRVDVLWLVIKDDQFRDDPVNPAWHPGQSDHLQVLPLYSGDRPEVMDVVADMRRVLDAYPDRLLIGEIYLPIERLVAYYGRDLSGAHLPFNFQLITAAWNARGIAAIIAEYEAALPPGAWPNWVLGNHDQPRIATRVGRAQARVAAMLLLTLRGTPTIYYGDEIGLQNVLIPADEVQDPAEKNQPGIGMGRDPERTPMPWDRSPQAGFTSGRPWLRLNDDADAVNVSVQSVEPGSILSLYRRLITLRRASPALSSGSYVPVAAEGDVLAYVRLSGTACLGMVLNLGHAEAAVPAGIAGEVVLSTHLDRAGEPVEPGGRLRPDEGVIVLLRE